MESDGPAFEFPKTLVQSPDVVVVEDEQLLKRNFSGWVPGEIEAGRAPVMAIVEDGYPVSICFCARSSDTAAEAASKLPRRIEGADMHHLLPLPGHSPFANQEEFRSTALPG
jgi:hypothetical protein